MREREREGGERETESESERERERGGEVLSTYVLHTIKRCKLQGVTKYKCCLLKWNMK